MSSVLNSASPFRATTRDIYAPELEALRGRHASGVYAILTRGQVLYVGESHTGRLYDTITRHFRRWRPRADPQGRRRGGTTYDRRKVLVMYALTDARSAQAEQYAAIQELRPRDNQVDGGTVCCGELPPF